MPNSTRSAPTSRAGSWRRSSSPPDSQRAPAGNPPALGGALTQPAGPRPPLRDLRGHRPPARVLRARQPCADPRAARCRRVSGRAQSLSWTGGVGPDRVAPCSPAVGVDHGHAAVGASEGGKFEFSFADETTVLVEHAGRVKPTVAGATKAQSRA